MNLYKIELCDKEENLLEQHYFDNKRELDKKYKELSKKYYYSAVLYVFIGNDIDNMIELKDKRIYYNGLYEVKKKKRKTPFVLIAAILYIITTPFAVLIKLGKEK